MTKMPYEQARKIVIEIEKKSDFWSKKLNSFPKGEMGLIPQEIKETQEYQHANQQFNATFQELQKINQWFLKNYKKEYLKERQERQYKPIKDWE